MQTCPRPYTYVAVVKQHLINPESLWMLLRYKVLFLATAAGSRQAVVNALHDGVNFHSRSYPLFVVELLGHCGTSQ